MDEGFDYTTGLDIGSLAKSHPRFVEAALTPDDITVLQKAATTLQQDSSRRSLISIMGGFEDDAHGRKLIELVTTVIFLRASEKR